MDDAAVPSDIRDPNAIKSPDGAVEAYYGTLVQFATALAGSNPERPPETVYTFVTGVMTDELRADGTSAFPASIEAFVDSRNTLAIYDRVEAHRAYEYLHRVRSHAQIARQALRQYAPNAPREFLGHLYAVEAFAEILVAELYCSGIPLSTVDLAGDYTLSRGFTTEEIYLHALGILDSAERYSGDSIRLQYFVNLGRARILLGLGKYNDAADVVAGIPETYQYNVSYAPPRLKVVVGQHGVLVANREGENGLSFLTDPRTQRPEFRDSTAPLTIASGLEAQLILAEADLHAGGMTWLKILNRLRTTCPRVDDCPIPAPAGTGRVAGLPPLVDPNPDSLPLGKTLQEARVDLLFAERAYWLFLTGHRQGDLRRLVRIYGRPSETVYPTGAWGDMQITPYGSEVVLPVPEAEMENNPLYRGCVNYDA